MLNIQKNLYTYLLILKHSKKVIVLSILLFFIGILIGFYLPTEIKTNILIGLEDKFADLVDDSPLILALKIFANNILIVGILLVLFFLVLPGLFIPITNGIAIGILANLQTKLVSVSDSSWSEFMLAILPHGLIEIAAFLIAVAMGHILILKIVLPKKFIPDIAFSKLIKSFITGFLIVLVPAMLVAALIESYITPALVKFVDTQKNDQKGSEIQSLVLEPADILDTIAIKTTDQSLRSNFNPLLLYLSPTLSSSIKVLSDDNLTKILKKIENLDHFQSVFENSDKTYVIAVYSSESKDSNKKMLNDITDEMKIFKHEQEDQKLETDFCFQSNQNKEDHLCYTQVDKFIVLIYTQNTTEDEITAILQLQKDKITNNHDQE